MAKKEQEHQKYLRCISSAFENCIKSTERSVYDLDSNLSVLETNFQDHANRSSFHVCVLKSLGRYMSETLDAGKMNSKTSCFNFGHSVLNHSTFNCPWMVPQGDKKTQCGRKKLKAWCQNQRYQVINTAVESYWHTYMHSHTYIYHKCFRSLCQQGSQWLVRKREPATHLLNENDVTPSNRLQYIYPQISAALRFSWRNFFHQRAMVNAGTQNWSKY